MYAILRRPYVWLMVLGILLVGLAVLLLSPLYAVSVSTYGFASMYGGGLVYVLVLLGVIYAIFKIIQRLRGRA